MTDEVYEAEVIGGEPGELDDVEKLAVAQALYNMVGGMVSTKTPGNLRDAVNKHYVGLYEQTGAKSFDVKLFGGKVGTFSVTTTKPVEQVKRIALDVVDEHEFELWAGSNGFIRTSYDWDGIYALFNETGEVPEGCSPRAEVTPGKPGGEVKSTSFSLDYGAVEAAIGPQIEGVNALLLGDGGDGL